MIYCIRCKTHKKCCEQHCKYSVGRVIHHTPVDAELIAATAIGNIAVNDFVQHPIANTAGFIMDAGEATLGAAIHPIETGTKIGEGLYQAGKAFFNANPQQRQQMLARAAVSFTEGEIATLGIGGIATIAVTGARATGAGTAMATAARVVGDSAKDAMDIAKATAARVSKSGMFGKGTRDGESMVGLTTRLDRPQIKNYLTNVKDIPREQLVNDLQSLGLEFKGGSKDGRFMEFIDKHSNLRIKIHPPDNVGTNYHHLHLYDKQGNPLTPQLEKASYKSSDVQYPQN